MGNSGPMGSQGAAGQPGPKGDAGPTGAQGSKGDLGSRGPAGTIGIPGVDGVQGSPGAQGQTGAVGPAGPPGAQGPSGIVGSLGQLDGTPCSRNGTAGTTHLTLDSLGYVQLRCVIPTSIVVVGDPLSCPASTCASLATTIAGFSASHLVVFTTNLEQGNCCGDPQVTTYGTGAASLDMIISWPNVCAPWPVPHPLLVTATDGTGLVARVP